MIKIINTCGIDYYDDGYSDYIAFKLSTIMC